MAPEFSKVVHQQMNNAQEITRAIHTHRRRILSKMAELLKPYMAEDRYHRFHEEVWALLELQLTYLEDITAQMGVVDLEHSNELRETGQARSLRDVAVSEVLKQVHSLKQTLAGTHGEDSLSIFGLTGETPRNPAELERWLANVVNIAAGGVLMPEPVIPTPAPWTAQHVLDMMRPLHHQLSEALGQVNQEQQEDKDTMTRKWEMMELQNYLYTAIAGIAECYARFSGDHDLGERLRPRSIARSARSSKSPKESLPDTPTPAISSNSTPQ